MVVDQKKVGLAIRTPDGANNHILEKMCDVILVTDERTKESGIGK